MISKFPSRRRLLLLIAFFAVRTIAAPVSTNLHAALREFLRLPRSHFTLGFVLTGKGFCLLADVEGLQQDARTWPKARAHYQDEPESLLELGRHLEKERRTNEAIELRARADEIFLRRLQSSSNDIRSLLGHAGALHALGSTNEEEGVLRAALKRAPEDWRVHAAWAGFHESRALRGIAYEEEALLPKPLTQTEINDLNASLRRAREIWSTAWNYAGDDSKAHFDYANFLAQERSFAMRLAWRQGEPRDTNQLLAAIIAPEVIDHFRKSLKNSKEPVDIATVAFFETVAAAAEERRIGSVDPVKLQGLAANLPSRSRRVLVEATDRLDALSHELPPDKGAAALEYRAALLTVFLRDAEGAIRAARQAVQLTPKRDSVRELLLVLYVREERWAEASALIQERLKNSESPLWRGYAAKIADYQEQTTEAEEHIRLALKFEPGNVQARLGVAAFALRRATNVAGMVRARISLTEARDAVAASRDLTSEAWRLQWIAYQVYAISYELLDGHTKDAARMVSELLRMQPDHEAGQKLEKLITRLTVKPNPSLDAR